MSVDKVMFEVLIQDPDVVSDPELRMAAIHPVLGVAAGGFYDGPACRRLAVVDLDDERGGLRDPAILVADGGRWRNVGRYDVTPPTGAQPAVWSGINRENSYGVRELRSLDSRGNPFIKVSTFGNVVRTISFIESPACLGRYTPWGFDGEQLLLIPLAGELDNAFYHREAHSLFFYYFNSPADNSAIVYSALSQDIVCHETAHALIDGIAPDLYDSVSPDGAAIHEAVADITACLIGLVNRELLSRGEDRVRLTLTALAKGGSRFSRIAEEFGRGRGHGTELRDLNNRRSLNPLVKDPKRKVNSNSAHALSEVLSGLFFDLLLSVLAHFERDPGHPFVGRGDIREYLLRPVAGRIGGMVYKGLDWLPPGDAGLDDFAVAVMAADAWHWPDESGERDDFANFCKRRHIASAARLAPATSEDVLDINFKDVMATGKAARALVRRHRRIFGVPEDQPFVARVTPVRRRAEDVRRWIRGSDTHANIDPPGTDPAETADLLLVKAGWWVAEPNELGSEFSQRRERMVGSTVAVDRKGQVHTVLRSGGGRAQAERRRRYLEHLVTTGVLLPPGRGSGPDGELLDGFVHATSGQTVRIEGGLRALHIADAPV